MTCPDQVMRRPGVVCHAKEGDTMRKLLVLAGLLFLGLAIGGPAAAQDIAGRPFTIQLLPTSDPDVSRDASGTAVLTVNPGLQTFCYDILVTGIGEPQEPGAGIGSAHIHVRPSGDIAVDLDTIFIQTAPDTYQATGCVTADLDVLIDILTNPELYYVNVHTAAAPTGALEGTLTMTP
jgi:CHRD domain-containing protein